MRAPLVLASLLAVSGALLVACGDDDAPAAPTGAAGAAGSAGGATVGGAGGQSGAPGGGLGTNPLIKPGGPANVATTYKSWDWVPVAGSLCRNYSETGFAYSAGAGADKDKVLVFVQGGNACFNLASCSVTFNPEGFGVPQFQALTDTWEHAGILDRDDPKNPFKDWTQVIVPYCSGDVFAGNKEGVTIEDTTYVFQGYKNMGLFLDAAAPKVAGASQVVLAGVSAGGFGTAFNFDRVVEKFAGTPVTVIDDSGPPMGPDWLTPCLQKKFDTLWNMSSNIPADCVDCKKPDGSFIESYFSYTLAKRKDLRFGLISSQSDETISSFWSFGLDECVVDLPKPYPKDKYKAGLVDFRDRLLAPAPNARVFYLEGQQHVWLVPNDAKPRSLADVKVGGDSLADWMAGAIDGGAGWKNVSAF